VHPGGPFWKKKDAGAWSIPKGEIEAGETALGVAVREFEEELGGPPPGGTTTSVGMVRQASGKVVHAWAVEGDFDTQRVSSNTFEMEWPPRSGKRQTFHEVDRAEWFDLISARSKIIAAQATFLDRLERSLSSA
jgi:predicted NUDIX family NTP pyrophosphohydrolase